MGMENCAAAHHQKAQEAGPYGAIDAARYAKPYVKRQKNDAIVAEAICEAVTRPSLRFVEVKTCEQQG